MSALSCARHHLLSRRRRAGEHHHVHLVDERRAGLAATRGDLEDVLRDPALREHLRHQQRGERGHLGWLQHHGVARRERRNAVPERVVQRVVPGADHTDDAEGRVPNQEPPAAKERRGRLDRLVRQVVRRRPGPELERREPVGELGELRLVGGPAGLADDRRDDPLGVRQHPATRREQHLGPPLESDSPPIRAAPRAPAPPSPEPGPRRGRERSRSSRRWRGSRPGYRPRSEPRSPHPRTSGAELSAYSASAATGWLFVHPSA